MLRKQLHEEELQILQSSRDKISSTSAKEKQEVLENLMVTINQCRESSEVDVLKAEADMLKHFWHLLKCRIDIENLLDCKRNEDNFEKIKLQLQNKLLQEEISKVQFLIKCSSLF